MSAHEHWQLEGSAPELYERYIVPAITSLLAADLIDRTQPGPTETVLDVACGTGVVTRLAAARAGKGCVVGLDFNAGMLAVARTVPSAGAPIKWVEGSALSLPFAQGSFGLVLCQLGLQFFPDRALALREMRSVLTPSGRLGLSVYSAIERTPAAHAFARALESRLGLEASKIKRAEHIFSEAEDVRALVTDAGFDQVEIRTVTQYVVFPSVLDYVRFQLIATPMAGLLAHCSEIDRKAAIEGIASATQALLDREMHAGGGLRFPQEAFVVTAARAA